MYANLRVTTKKGKALWAWKVDIGPDGIVVHLDDPEGPEDSYANPAGELHFAPSTVLRIEANF